MCNGMYMLRFGVHFPLQSNINVKYLWEMYVRELLSLKIATEPSRAKKKQPKTNSLDRSANLANILNSHAISSRNVIYTNKQMWKIQHSITMYMQI